MSGSAGVVDFFALEASEYLERMDVLLASGGSGAPDAEPFVRNARALRGAATMARHAALADLASALEAVALALRDGSVQWTVVAADALVGAVDAFKRLLRRVREWSDADAASAAARATELRGLVATTAAPARPGTIVPIGRLFYDDAGPHVVERNPHPAISADLRFRQAAVPLASTLRRLIDEARHTTDSASRSAAGQDLGAAIRDLGELAESYDIRPVVNFARARERALGELEERALDVVDGAAQSLIESAGTAWARPTPPAATGVIEPPAPAPAPAPAPPPAPAAAPAAAVEPPTEAPARETTPAARPELPESAVTPLSSPVVATPASGQALVALLETSISGISQIGTAPSPLDGVHVDGAEEIVPVGSLLYRGRRALDRAREVRDALRAAPTPDPILLAELYDLIDLAASG